MANVGKASDGMLDLILVLQRQRDAMKDWLEIYQESNLIPPEVASHLWEILMGLNEEDGEPDDGDIPGDRA